MNVRSSLGLMAAGLLTVGVAQSAFADDYFIDADFGFARGGCDGPVYYDEPVYYAPPVRYYRTERYYYAPEPVVYHRTRVYRSRTYYAPPPVTYRSYRSYGHHGRSYGGSVRYYGDRGGFRAGFHYSRR